MILNPGKKYILLLFLLPASMLSQAQGGMNPEPAAHSSRLSFTLSAGYQSEDLRWSIAGNTQGANPNILSELKWKKLAGPTLEAAVKWKCWKSFELGSTFSHHFITSGSVTDMDYQGDNRTNRSYYGAFDANKGMSFSWRTTLGYPFHLSRLVTLTPSLGYALHRQSLYLLSSDQSGAAAGLKSTYATKYEGAVIGLRGDLHFSARLSLEAALFYDIVHYRGRANWNLISTFRHPISFEDQANGYNLEGNVKLNYSLNGRWMFFLAAGILHSATGTGTDWLYLQTGQNIPTQFNGAVRDYVRSAIGARLSLF
ncbi:hypothetical protein Q4E93_10615 [Flavitalea sp. BT771]|uniref:hypothetical protein n=1 Tax=Flavitalea sp. BT771 TaxID=3063329 RepID=UPI0026E364D4|nr:hypothetical protein [Flavitalea sp. BT771]MDO6431042.1 hypothetical protein [Flavitalea sp. BT771]MDV6219949.1 hypothetical protein [Flavitalea sp. BT771]